MTIAQLRERIVAAYHHARLTIVTAVIVARPYVVAMARYAWGQLVAGWKAFVAWLGPAAESVRGQLNPAEVQRVATKAVVSASACSLWNLVTDPEFVSVIIVPAGVGILIAILDGVRRAHHGEAKQPPDQAPPV